MRYAPALLLLTIGGIAAAQTDKPQLTWSGYVTGSATLYIQGDRLDAQGRETGAIDRPNYKFSSPLPAARTRVDVTARRGRGRVTVSEQPIPGNEYTAAIQIDPPGNRTEYYVLDFFWDEYGNRSSSRDSYNRGTRDEWEGRARTAEAVAGEVRWSGDVDIQALVEIRGNRVSSRAVRGRPVVNEHIDITSPLPRTETSDTRILDVTGRGEIELIEPPNSQNGYRALVRISDSQPGRGSYSFRLVWSGTDNGYDRSTSTYSRNDRYSQGNGGVLSPSDGGYAAEGTRSRSTDANTGYARWTGRVDGRVHVTIQGNRATVQTVSGRPVSDMNVDFGGGSGIPYGNVADVQIRKLQGRGEVRLVHNPDANNRGSLAFEVNDDEGGPDYYEVELTWRSY